MTKDIKDYLPLYLGCEVMTETGIGQLVVVGMLGSDSQRFRIIHPAMSYTNDWDKSNKIILRPLSDMTDEEINEVQSLGFRSAEAYRWHLSKGFDLFGLIDAGLAIDKTTI